MASSTMLSTSERNNMGRERLLTCLSECGAENEPVVLLELQKAYFNKFDEYLNKAELRKFFSKGHIKQVFENFMPKDVEMATDVNATGSLFLKMKRPLRTALTDSPKSAPLMTMPKNGTEANRPALVPLPSPAPPAEPPEPSRNVLPATENKFAVPVAAHKLLPPNRKESFSLTGGFGGAINKAEEDDLLEDFVPRNTNGTTSRDRSGDTARGGGNNNETSTLVAYDGCESERRKANDGEKEKASVPATAFEPRLTMRAKPNRTLWDYDCDDGEDEKKTTPTNAKGGGDNNNNGVIARERPQQCRDDGGGDNEKDAEDDKDYEAEEGDSSGDLLGDSALEDGYQQLKRQAAASAGSGRRERNGVKPSSVGIDGVPKSQQQQQTRRRAGVASSDDDDEVAEIGGLAAATDRAIGSLSEAKWAEERRARDSLVAERLRSRKQREQQEDHQQKQSRTMTTAGTNRDATWYDDDDETTEEEQGPKKCNAGYGKRVQMSGVKPNNNNNDDFGIGGGFGIGGRKFDHRVSSTSSSFGVANRPDNNNSKTKPKLYGGNDRFRDVPPPPFSPNLMSSDDDEGEKKDDDEENEEEGESEKEKKKVRQQDGAVQLQQKNKNNNDKPMLKHEDGYPGTATMATMGTMYSLHLPTTTLTPPQSAPPQKTTSHAFFIEQRIHRSKSPGERSGYLMAPPTPSTSGGTMPSTPGCGAASNAGSASSLASRGGEGGGGGTGTTGSGGLFGISRRGCIKYGRKSNIEDWAIKHSDVLFREKIGNGSFGTVYKAEYFGTVAVKKLNISSPGAELLLAFKNEVTVLKKARHGNVLNFLGVIKEPELAIVTQWCQGSSLYRHIHVVEPRVEFETQTVLDICKQISQGMDYLHSRGVIHRDLKTNNIFLAEGTTVKIGDFGLATIKSRTNTLDGAPNPNPTGSILWMAPEVIRMDGLEPYSTRSDVYSFGICVYELLTSRLPYEEIKNRDQILWMVGSGRLRPSIADLRTDTPKQLRQIFEQCTRLQRDERPEFRIIYTILDSIRLPKLKKSTSEPNLRRLALSGSAGTSGGGGAKYRHSPRHQHNNNNTSNSNHHSTSNNNINHYNHQHHHHHHGQHQQQ